MSREIDERVLQMRFDNAQFERETSRTMNTLQKLKASLNFNGVAKGFGNVASETNIIHKNMQVLQGGVQSVKNEFSSLQVIGATALVNLTNSAIRAGKNITNALTIQPVTTGFQEYETKMGSIQTIMTNTASKGTKMQDVIRVIDELNTYADKTIYNFAEMTRNIGTFTAAGIGLEDAASAIQGIANLAAASGSNSQQASTAMYQLSQALAAGTVKLQDWNSVVNAGMGGELFQNALKETAKEMGIAVDDIIENAGSFRESLSKGWMTADVLNTTLRKFTKEGAKEYARSMQEAGNYTQEQTNKLLDQAEMCEDAATKVKTFTQLWDTLKETAQSGWGKTWELLVGNFDEAKNLFTALNDRFSPLIDKFSDARNALVEKALGSPSKWDDLIKRVNRAGITTEMFEEAIKNNMKSQNMNVDELIEKYGSVRGFIEGTANGSDIARSSIKKLTGSLLENMNATEGEIKDLQYWQDVVDRVWRGDFKNAPERYELLAEAEYDYAKVQELVNKTVDGHRLTLADLSYEELVAMGVEEKHAKRLKELADAASQSGSDIDEMINSLNKKKGRALLLESLYNILDAIGKMCKTVGQAFKEVFTPITADSIYSAIEAFNKWTKSLILTDRQALALKNVLKTILTVFDTLGFVIGSVTRLVLGILGEVLKGLNMDFADLSGEISDVVMSFRDWIKENDIINKAINVLSPALQKLGKFIDKVIHGFDDTSKVTRNMSRSIEEAEPTILDVMKTLLYSIGTVMGEITAGFLSKFGLGDIVELFKNIYGQFKTQFLAAIGIQESEGTESIVMALWNSAIETIQSKGEEIGNTLKDVFMKALNWFKENVDPGMIVGGYFIMSLKGTVDEVIDLVGKFAGPAEKLGDMFESIGGIADELADNIKAMRFSTKATGILLLAGAIGVLAGAMYLISKIPKEDQMSALLCIATMAVIVGVMMKVVSQSLVLDKESEAMNIAGIIAVVVGLGTMVLALKALSKLSYDEIGRGVLALTGCLGLLLLMMLGMGAITKKMDVIQASAINQFAKLISRFGLAMLMLALTVKIAGKTDKQTLKRGMLFIAGCSLMMGIVVDAMRGNQGVLANVGTGGALIGFAIAVGILVGVIQKAASVDDRTLKQGLKVTAAAELLVLVMAAMNRKGAAVKAGLGLIAMVIATGMMIRIVKEAGSIEGDILKKAKNFIMAMKSFFGMFLFVAAYAGKGAMEAGVGMIAMAAAMAALVGVVKLISFLEPKEIVKGLAAITVMGLVMSLLLVSTRKSRSAYKNILAMMACMVALTGCVVVMYAMSKDYKRLGTAVAAVVLLMLGLALMIKASAGIRSGELKAVQKVLNKITFILMMMIGVIAALYFIPEDKGLLDKVRAIQILMSSMSFMIFSIGSNATKLRTLKTDDLKNIGKLLLEIGAVMIGCIGILFAINAMGLQATDWKVIAQVSTLMVVLTGLAIVVAKLGVVTNSKGLMLTWATIGILGAIMLGVTGIMILMNNINTEGLIDKVLAVSLLMTVLTGLAVATIAISNVALNVAGLIGAAAILLVMTGVLWAVTGIMNDINNIPLANGLDKKIYGIVILMGALTLCAAAVMVFSITVVNPIGLALAALLLIALVDVFVKLVPVLDSVSKIQNYEGLMSKVLGLCVLMIGLTIASLLITTFGKLVDPIGIKLAMTTMMAMSTLLPVLAGVLTSMDSLNGENAFNNASALAKVLIAMAVCCAILVAVGAFREASLKGVGVLSELGSALIELLDKLMDTITENLPGFGIALANFGMSMTIFASCMEQVSEEAAEGAKRIAIMIGAILGSDLLSMIMSFLGGDDWIDTFQTKLLSFAEAIVAFSNAIKGKIDITAVRTATSAGEMLATLQKSMGSRPEWLKKIIGDKDMGKFGDRLKSFASGMSAFAGTLKAHEGEFDQTKIENFCNAVKPLVDLSKDIPNEGGVLGNLIGENNINDWSQKLKPFAEGFVDFYAVMSGAVSTAEGATAPDSWDPSVFENFAKCVTPLIKIANDIPNSGGILATWIGDNDLGTFAEGLPKLGAGLKGFWYHAQYADFSDVTFYENLATCMVPIITMCNAIKNSGGIFDIFTGTGDIGEFGDDLESFGLGLSKFDQAIVGSSELRSTRGKNMVLNIKEIIENLPSKLDITTFCNKVKTMTDNEMGTRLTELGGMLMNWSNAIEGINDSNLSSAATSLSLLTSALDGASNLNFTNVDQFGSSLKGLGGDTISSFVSGIENGYSTVNDAMDALIADILDKFKFKLYNFKLMGKHAAEKIGDGVAAMKEEVWKKFKEAFDYSIDELNKYEPKMYEVGKFVSDGLINGIESRKEDLKRVAAEMGSIVKDSTAGALEERSPSKAMFRIGDYAGQGLINGMVSTLSGVSQAADELGENTTETLGGLIGEMVRAFDDENLNPTITPVLDLTEVRSGFGNINDMLATSTITARSINTVGGNYDVTNGDLLKAINTLNDTLSGIEMNNFTIGNITYDDGSNVSTAIKQLITAAQISKR